MVANLSSIHILPNRVPNIYVKLNNVISKLHNTSASIAHIKKGLFVDVVPNFAVVKEEFINDGDSLTASRKIMKSHLTKHVQDFNGLSMQYNDLKLLVFTQLLVLYLLYTNQHRMKIIIKTLLYIIQNKNLLV